MSSVDWYHDDDIEMINVKSQAGRGEQGARKRAAEPSANGITKNKAKGKGTGRGKLKAHAERRSRAKEAAKRNRVDRREKGCTQCSKANEECRASSKQGACLRCKVRKVKCVVLTGNKKGEDDSESGGDSDSEGNTSDDEEDEDSDEAISHDPNPLALVVPSRHGRMPGPHGLRNAPYDGNDMLFGMGVETQVLRMVADSVDRLSLQNQMMFAKMNEVATTLTEVKHVIGKREGKGGKRNVQWKDDGHELKHRRRPSKK